MASKFELGVKFVTKADTTGIENLNDELKETERSTKKGKKGFKGLDSAMAKAAVAAGVVGAGLVAAKVAMEQIERGAQLQNTQQAFENLAGVVDTTAEQLLPKLQVATKNTVSDMELMASAGELISLGLVQTEDETIRFSRAVASLGLDMQVLGLTLANDSTARLDSLGLSMVDVKEKTDKFTASGVEAGKAFDLAVLEALEERIDLLGDAAETTSGDIATLSADLQNLKDDAAVLAAVTAGPLVKGLSDSSRTYKAFTQARKDGLLTEKEQIALIQQVQEDLGKQATRTEVLAEQMVRLDEIRQDNIDSLEAINEATESHDRTLTGTIKNTEDLVEATEELTEEEIEANEATLDLIKSGQRFADEYSKVAQVSERAAAKFETLRQKTEAAKTTFSQYNTVIAASDPLIEDYILAQSDMIEAQGEWVEVNRDNSQAIADINAELFSDLDSDQRAALVDVVATAEEGGAEWIAAFDGVQADLSESQRNALIARRTELEASQGDIASVYTGDIAAFEAAQQAKADAARALSQVISEEGFKQIESRILAEGGDDAIEQIKVLEQAQVNLGLKTQEAADIAIKQAEAFGQVKEVADILLDEFLADGELTIEENERLTNSLGLIADGADLTTQQLVQLGLQGTEHAETLTTAFMNTDESIIMATGSVDVIATKLAALPDEVVVNVRINQIGNVPGGLGGSVGSVANTAAATSTAAANSQNDRMGGT